MKSKAISTVTKSLPDFFDYPYKSLVFNRYSFFLKTLKYKKVNYPSTYKSELHISNSLKINAFPTTIIIDKNGAIIFMETGFNKEKVIKTIKDLIKQ